nr:MAG TPA: hypothetical protein [Caudoviricetes sp.]
MLIKYPGYSVSFQISSIIIISKNGGKLRCRFPYLSVHIAFKASSRAAWINFPLYYYLF